MERGNLINRDCFVVPPRNDNCGIGDNFIDLINEYNYNFPHELIAQNPANPRDSAKLLIYKQGMGKMFFDTFSNLTKYLPKDAVLVFNETKVIPARLTLKKETGGKVKILYIKTCRDLIKVLADTRLRTDSKLNLNNNIFFRVEKQEEKYYFLKPSFPVKNLYNIFEKYGQTPLPPYIKNTQLNEDELRDKYQTVFAKIRGSVAAPTASLHFTKRLLSKIENAGFDIRFTTLHVNLGTFAPLTEENIKTQKLHSEYYSIDTETAAFLSEAKKSGRPIVAIGTTVVRTLESASDNKGNLVKLLGETELFIKEGYKFKFVDGIVTNFHVPKSSLLMLVAAFIGKRKMFELYRKAIERKFRLFSFGDGMMIY